MALDMCCCATRRRSGPAIAGHRASEPKIQADSNDSNTQKLVLHYIRLDGDYQGWGLHVWGGAACPTEWEKPLQPENQSSTSASEVTFVVKGSGMISFLVHRDEEKDGGEQQACAGGEFWIVSGWECKLFSEAPDLASILLGTLDEHRAFWVLRNVILLPKGMVGDSDTVKLHSSRDASLEVTKEGVKNADRSFALIPEPQVPLSVATKFPHLKGFRAFMIPEGLEGFDARALIKTQLAVDVVRCSLSATWGSTPVDATGLQIAGVIDDLCRYEGPLGIHFAGDMVTLRLWAPTAQSVAVSLHGKDPNNPVYSDPLTMEEGSSGEWIRSFARATAENHFFRYHVKVFCPWNNKITAIVTTDPYSQSLSANGAFTQIADLSSYDSKPDGWDHVELPAPVHPIDMSIYELHVRDFSATDSTVPIERKGTYAAFSSGAPLGGGMSHLSALAKSGMTHLHLLPVYDFGSVDERKSTWQEPKLPNGIASLQALPADGETQQEVLSPTFDYDAYNWGYDPVHFFAAEGSYAIDPDGLARVREFRGMVSGLASIGLRVVMDVVYNHVFSSGPDAPTSVLDKVVPGYYLRRSLTGAIENSTCMNNTASEHFMFERLVIDSVLHWAIQYKVSAFRFDLMGHIMLSTMQRLRAALNGLTVEANGVDGKSVYLYGEGWEFGEVAGGARGCTACQLNLAGTGVGSFNDRIRESIVGGNPFGDPRQQGFASGLAYQENEFARANVSPSEQSASLSSVTERLIAGLAGSVSEFKLVTNAGNTISGRDAGSPGSNCAYVSSPNEIINYVSAHDNETLFDMMVWKLASGQGPDAYARRSLLCSAMVAYAQGIPFFHAGDDTLRSKSLDRDSYNSGDHFNRLDWSLQSNNFAVGLPPRSKNEEKWDLMRPMLRNAKEISPPPSLIIRTASAFRELLQVRFSSPLFRLRTGADICDRVRFHNQGPKSIPGIIVMELLDHPDVDSAELDHKHRRVVVVFNALPHTCTCNDTGLLESTKNLSMQLHPVLASSADIPTRGARWPTGSAPVVEACSAAVFVAMR